MMGRTHMLFGFLVGLFAIQALHPSNQILFIFLVVLGALLPDIDHPDSKIGSKVRIVGALFEHRGFFHSLFAVALFVIPFWIFTSRIYAYAILIGVLSHLLADMISHMGIMPFAPISRFKLRGFIKTNSIGENIILVVVFLLSIWKLVSL
ncbi:MAG: metal-dependent hydrolase [Nanoarchaeota archaeon]|nr:metal-dependent hydrolase [Nanoarchaeota archaeon]